MAVNVLRMGARAIALYLARSGWSSVARPLPWGSTFETRRELIPAGSTAPSLALTVSKVLPKGSGLTIVPTQGAQFVLGVNRSGAPGSDRATKFHVPPR